MAESAVAGAPGQPVIARIAVPGPRHALYDYWWPAGAPTAPGVRVEVPFGRGRRVGFLVEIRDRSELPPEKLREAGPLLDAEPLWPEPLWRLLRWAAQYYHHPLGLVLAGALPPTLKRGQAREAPLTAWALVPDAPAPASPSAQAQALWARLASGALVPGRDDLTATERRWLRRWEASGAVRLVPRQPLPPDLREATPDMAPRSLTAAQSAALTALREAKTPSAWLLRGVTGSGKTEVYLAAIREAVAARRQALLLVPEIGLTPQLLTDVARLGLQVVSLHSGLAAGARARAWAAAASGEADLVIGTRSAVFVPLQRPGLIVVDEEHDLSYKQSEGFRYHARDLALLRGQYEQVPVVLGSATPSLETLYRVTHKGIKRLDLPERVHAQRPPRVELVDLPNEGMVDGLAPRLLARLHEVRRSGAQSLLFINRRGYAPVHLCAACGHIDDCPRCDAHLVWHARAGLVRCHHCGYQRVPLAGCPTCGDTKRVAIGSGTERIETALAHHFPDARVVRVDRDTTRGRGQLAARLDDAREADFLVGTQMLSKGHDFPRLHLVAVLAADAALARADFRAPEQGAQLLFQVAGRAGRRDVQGEVWVQTYRPADPFFAAFRAHDYEGLAHRLLAERRDASYPPYAHLALLEAESRAEGEALAFLSRERATIGLWPEAAQVTLYDPVPALMERKAGRYRARLLLASPSRNSLHTLLARWVARLEQTAARVTWRLDVDPMVIEP